MTARGSWGRGRGTRGHGLRGVSGAPRFLPHPSAPRSPPPALLPAGPGLARPLRGEWFRRGLRSTAHPAPSRRHRKQDRPKQWPGTPRSRAPPEAHSEPRKNAAAATVPSGSERRAPGAAFAAERGGRGASSAPSRPHPSPTYRRRRPPWRRGSPAGSPGRSRQSGLVPRWPAGSGEPAQTPREPPPPPQRQSSALKRLSLRLPTAPPVGTAPRFDTAQSSPGPPVCSALDAEAPFSWANQRARSRRSSVGRRETVPRTNQTAGRGLGTASETKESRGWLAPQ